MKKHAYLIVAHHQFGLLEQLLRLLERQGVRFHWVKGHAENPFNNRCDEMAVAEWKKIKGV